jgi:prefoldin subunit 5
LWVIVGSNLITLVLAVIFILVFLSALNGGLRYARPAQLLTAQARLEALDRQAGELQAGLDEVNTRLEDLQDLGARLRIVQEETDALSQAMRDSTGRVDGFQAQMEEIALQVDALLARVSRFQKFIDGLEVLLASLKEVEAP